MLAYVVISIVSGIAFGFMDGMINANPYARKLFTVYEPIARKTINIAAGMIIDLVYGFVMAGMFLALYDGLPGESGVVKGLSYAVIAWFFRVVMGAASQWMMFQVTLKLLFYNLVAGLGEMLVLGLLYGLTLTP